MSFARGFIIGGFIGALLHWCVTHWRGVIVALGLIFFVTTCNAGLSSSNAHHAEQSGMTIRNVDWNRNLEGGFSYDERIVVEITNPSSVTLKGYSGSCNDGQFEFKDDTPVAPRSTVLRMLEYDEYSVSSGIPYNPFEDRDYRPCEFTDAEID